MALYHDYDKWDSVLHEIRRKQDEMKHKWPHRNETNTISESKPKPVELKLRDGELIDIRPFTILEKQIQSSIKKNKFPSLTIIPLTSFLKFANESENTIFSLHIAKWIRENASGGVYGFSASTLWYPSKNAPILAFEKEIEAKKFYSWLKEFSPKFKKWSTNRKRQLFLSGDDFKKEFDAGKPLVVEAVVSYRMVGLDRGEYVTKEIAELWFWIQEHCHGKVWRNKGGFHFENKEEATHFKLVWFETKE